MPGKTAIELGPLWYVMKHNNTQNWCIIDLLMPTFDHV
jgi:hypothetical protein